MFAVFDIEANALLRELSEIHCLVIRNETGVHVYRKNANEDTIEQGIKYLATHSLIVGHNIQSFDIPAMCKVYKKMTSLVRGIPLYDTIITSRVAFSNRLEHSLASWGETFKNNKGDFVGPWNAWSQEMETYCIQDVNLTHQLYIHLLAQNISENACKLEHKFAAYLDVQMTHGIRFNVSDAVDLKLSLESSISVAEEEIKKTTQPNVVTSLFTPKVNNVSKGYVKGQTIERRTETPFNPGSRDQVAHFLIRKYGWSAVEKTEGGKPKVTGDILSKLSYPEAGALANLFDAKKLYAQLYNGDNGWLKKVRMGRIYGRVNHNGAVTGRCTHSGPNLSQVPRVTSFMGERCRALFLADAGHVLVGVDASGLELRNLAHYLHPLDNGTYTSTILEGDIHTKNKLDAGLETRAQAKTFIYAFNYGAGDELLGDIVSPEATQAMKRVIGSDMRRKFLMNNPAIALLKDKIKFKVQTRGHLVGLDGRKLPVREDYRGLNVLLQAAGAVAMKKASCILWQKLEDEGLAGTKVFPVLHIHDEFQMSTHPDVAEHVRLLGIQSIREAGEFFKYNCPLDGEGKIGKNWSETH